MSPLTRRSPPGPGHPIDAFVHAKLQGKGIIATGEADRRTLIRRLYFDLIGLPPTPEEVDASGANHDPRAYENLVDRLLSSPRYGEHWGRHWLDVVGYADTHGNDHDYARPNAWPYRDYDYGRSTNKTLRTIRSGASCGRRPVPGRSPATVALGFLAAGPWDDTLMATIREDTVDHRLSQYLDRDNMVSTVMGTFQSLTVHCAPLSQSQVRSDLSADYTGCKLCSRRSGRIGRTTLIRGPTSAVRNCLRGSGP